MTKIVELRQDRNLIRTNFDGYKLSLDSIPLLKQELTSPPLYASPNDDQYSLLHAELFAMQNLLQVDPWSRTQCYFVNSLQEIQRVSYNENSGRPEAIQVVFRLSDKVTRQKGDYNYTFRFVSEKYCILCDGIKTLFLFDTGDRFKAVEWKSLSECIIDGPTLDKDERNYVIYDARLDIQQEQKTISLVLGHVQRVVATGMQAETTHFMYLHWAKLILKDQTWNLEILETLETKGSIFYCAFEPKGDSLIISCNREIQWRSQKSAINSNNVPEAIEEDKPQLHDNGEQELYDFSWSQTSEDVFVKFSMKPGKEKTDYNISCLKQKLSVRCDDDILLDQALFAPVDEDMTTWTAENNDLQITLVKNASGVNWTSLLCNNAGPLENSEENPKNGLPLEQQPISNLEAPIEDCDFPMEAMENEITLARFYIPTKSITHTVIMGSTPPLFSTSIRPGFPNAFVTRQDIDACIWLQQYNPAKPDEWQLRHEGNLNAFGYVQASKQQKKFMDCSPDLSYAIICESHRHIFLYKSKYDSANGLRNRSGPQVAIGKQHLITLDDAGEVLGMSTANNVVTLLTKNCVMHLQIN